MKMRLIGLALLLTTFLSTAPMLNSGMLGAGAVVTAQTQTQSRNAAREALIARAKSFELNTPYVPPPGDPDAHEASGYAKVMCSAVFITRLDPDFAAKNIGGFTGRFRGPRQVWETGHRSRQQDRHHYRSKRSKKNCQIRWQSGVRHAPDRQGLSEL